MSQLVEQTDEQMTETEYPFLFKGNATEYFKIWIVNIALTLLTLGVFSAWAKVRTHRYFYGNTFLDGSSFEYLANPIAILKGRIIAVLFFAVYWVATTFVPILILPVMLAFLIGFPWVITRSMLFRARNTAYRNIRFGFNGGYGEALKTFILWPILIPFTIGLIWPYIHFKQKRMLIANSEFGESGFVFNAEPKQFYQIYAIAIVMLIIIPIAFSLFAAIMAILSPESAQDASSQAVQPGYMAMIIGFLAAALMFALQYLVYVFVSTRITNLVFSSSEMGQTRLHSQLTVPAMMWIYFSNAAAIILSAGLLVPWAKIRLARYRADNTKLYATGGLDHYRVGAIHGASALGEEAGEIFDVDISI